MAKQKYNSSALMSTLLGKATQPAEPAETEKSENSEPQKVVALPETKVSQPAPVVNPVLVPVVTYNEPPQSAKPKKVKLRHQSYYLTEELIEAIAIREFKMRNEKPKPDKSLIVRKALESLLVDELDEIRKRG